MADTRRSADVSDHHTATPEPHAGTAHPVIASRLLEAMASLTNLVDYAPAEVFVTDEGWLILQRHMESVEKLAAEAEGLRPRVTGL